LAGDEALLERDVLEVLEQVRFPGAEVAGDEPAGRLSAGGDAVAGVLEQLHEALLDVRLGAAERPDRVAVGDTGSQRFDGAPLLDRIEGQLASLTRAASGFGR